MAERTSESRAALNCDRHTEQSGANAAKTTSTPTGKTRKILWATVKYSADVTQNVTVTLNSGTGTAWDTLLGTIVLTSAQAGFWIPETPLTIIDDDVIDVVAPAGGAGITSAVAIYSEVS